jgi:hypothetical protein
MFAVIIQEAARCCAERECAKLRRALQLFARARAGDHRKTTE